MPEKKEQLLRICPHCRTELGPVDASQCVPCDECGKPRCLGCPKQCKPKPREQRRERGRR